MTDKVRYANHPRKAAGQREGGRFVHGRAVKVLPVVTTPKTVTMPTAAAANKRSTIGRRKT